MMNLKWCKKIAGSKKILQSKVSTGTFTKHDPIAVAIVPFRRNGSMFSSAKGSQNPTCLFGHQFDPVAFAKVSPRTSPTTLSCKSVFSVSFTVIVKSSEVCSSVYYG